MEPGIWFAFVFAATALLLLPGPVALLVLGAAIAPGTRLSVTAGKANATALRGGA